MLSTGAAGDRTLKLVDGAGRTLRTALLADDDSALTQSTYSYGTVAAVAGYGDVIETTVTNLPGEVTKVRTDAAGRTPETVDALGNVSTLAYDAGGNLLSVRDPEGVGADYAPDALGRDVTVTDTAGAVTTTVYDSVGQVISHTDAEGETATAAFDARGRRTSATDRLGHVTSFTYDTAGDLLSLTDAEGGVTSYSYDAAGRKVSETYPDHIPGSAVGTADYGIVELAYDAAGRLQRRTDQLGRTVTHVYDLIGRRTAREYRTAANSPAGPIADRDDFSYDDAGRLLTAAKGRYVNAVAFAYDDAGRVASEGLTTNGQTYTIGRGLRRRREPGGTDLPGRHDRRSAARRPRPVDGRQPRRAGDRRLRPRRRRSGDDANLRQRAGHHHQLPAERQPAGLDRHADRRHTFLRLRREQEPHHRDDRRPDERVRLRHRPERVRRRESAGELGTGPTAA